MLPKIINRGFCCYVKWMGFDNISLGVSVNWWLPNVEIHLPFCFIRVGWQGMYIPTEKTFYDYVYGKKPWWWERL